MGVFLEPADLSNFAEITDGKANDMIEDAEALAMLAAPCLVPDFDPELTLPQAAAVKAVLRGAILRWNEAGTGALAGTTQAAGPFSQGQTLDTRTPRKNMFWPSEITQLQDICKGESVNSGAFSVDTVGTDTVHAEACSINFGATYCSCGADIAGFPIWEV